MPRLQLNFNLDTHDWEENYQLARDSFSSAVSQNSPTSSSFIAVSHDIHEQTVHGYVQYMIDQAREHKYELVTVGECLGDPPNNWYRDPKSGQQFGGPPLPSPKVIVASSLAMSSTSLPSSSTLQSVSSTAESPSSAAASTRASTSTSSTTEATTPSTPARSQITRFKLQSRHCLRITPSPPASQDGPHL